MTRNFSDFLRNARLNKNAESKDFSLRKVAARAELEPSYLSKIERGTEAPPSEDKIKALAIDLEIEPDVLLAMAGKVSKELQDIIIKRPMLFGEMLRELKQMPDRAILKIVREVRDGEW
tara:strand:- start:4124 stop:4480 length:357 start_codon:yes stop_codon:yes gene_type:complete